MLQMPSRWVVLFCLLLFGFGELAGALLGGFPQQITELAQSRAKSHPEMHGLMGVADIDRAILDAVGGETLARVHTFHLHSHGLALVVFLLNFIIANSALAPGSRKILGGLACLGLLYPFGWLTVVLTLPAYGKVGAFGLAERLFFIPFGGGFLGVVWLIILFYWIRTFLKRGTLPAA